MSPLLIACLALGLLALLSLAANHRLASRSRLPMQWSWRGAVTWTAPRPVALAFTPALAALVLGCALAANTARPVGAWIIAVVAGAFLGAHLLHLALMLRQGKAD